VLLAIGTLLLAWPALARYRVERKSHYVATIEKLKDNLYLIQATGMNVTALVTDAGVILVDTLPAGWWGAAALGRIRSVTDKPITTIINTHSHEDHIGNAPLFSATMADVLMHENSKSHIQHSDVAGANKPRFDQATTFADHVSLRRGTQLVDVYFFGRGHTGGDAWVVFPDLHTMHVGDLAWKHDAPSFDRTAGGSGVAYPETLARGLAATEDVDTIIVGHSGDASTPIMSRSELQASQRFGALLLSRSREFRIAGKTASETAASIRTQPGFSDYSLGRILRAVEAIYAELDGPEALGLSRP
jgi:glyoxylase-like metal-dependent hydrolase (beta-lactamase superfamily II)